MIVAVKDRNAGLLIIIITIRVSSGHTVTIDTVPCGGLLRIKLEAKYFPLKILARKKFWN